MLGFGDPKKKIAKELETDYVVDKATVRGDQIVVRMDGAGDPRRIESYNTRLELVNHQPARGVSDEKLPDHFENFILVTYELK